MKLFLLLVGLLLVYLGATGRYKTFASDLSAMVK